MPCSAATSCRWCFPTALRVAQWRKPRARFQIRSLLTLAIETSCDDTCVAVLETHRSSSGHPYARLHFHEKITADNTAYEGIHPVLSNEAHQANLAGLIQKALHSLPRRKDGGTAFDPTSSVALPPARSSDATEADEPGAFTIHRKPDFVTVTRGPGMRSSLATGLNTAKGLALAWSVPLLGVNHMQAHALTPRLVSALAAAPPTGTLQPQFPFLSLLVSGGHTLLLHSTSLAAHRILASTADIALGDCIDKVARVLLPREIVAASVDTNYGRLLERFAFPPPPPPSPTAIDDSRSENESDGYDYAYTPPARRHEELAKHATKYGWSLTPPLSETRAGAKNTAMAYSFAGLDSQVRRIVEARSMDDAERPLLAREAMRVGFEHLAGRVVMALKVLQEEAVAAAGPALEGGGEEREGIGTLVLSGGVAANGYLAAILRAFLRERGFGAVRLARPPPALCTDNAAMVAWCGAEMWAAGWRSELAILPRRKWALDPDAEDGGVLGAEGWKRRARRGNGGGMEDEDGDEDEGEDEDGDREQG